MTQQHIENTKNFPEKTRIETQAFALLKQTNLVEQSIYDLISSHPKPVLMLEMIQSLYQAGILNKQNIKAIAEYKEHHNLRWSLVRLSPNILNQHIFDLIQSFKGHLSHLTSFILDLKKADILNHDNLSLILNHAKTDELLDAVFTLNLGGILNQAHIQMISQHSKPQKLAHVLVSLEKSSILTEKNKELVVQHPFVELLNTALIYLVASNLLTQAHFDALIDPEHTALLCKETQRIIWNRIEGHLLKHNWPKILYVSRQNNPLKELEKLSSEILKLHTQLLSFIDDAIQSYLKYFLLPQKYTAIQSSKLPKEFVAQLEAKITQQFKQTDIIWPIEDLQHIIELRYERFRSQNIQYLVSHFGLFSNTSQASFVPKPAQKLK